MPRLDPWRRHKFKAIRTEVDGHVFPSKREAQRYQQLKLMEKAKAISKLELQPKYELYVKGTHICDYIADFRYREEGLTIVEDVKGFKTPEYRLKKKLMKALFAIEIKET